MVNSKYTKIALSILKGDKIEYVGGEIIVVVVSEWSIVSIIEII